MTNKLEKFANDNRAEFDIYQPDPNVWNKISKNTKKPKSIKIHILRYAAAVVIFAFGFTFGNYNKETKENKSIHSLNKTEHIHEASLSESEFYYNSQINNKLKQLEPYFSSDPGLKKDLEYDFNELNQFYNDLKSNLNNDINNEEVIEAMIQSHQMKLEILESLLQQLKQESYESPKIDI